MQSPGRFDLDLYRGDTYRFQVRLWDDVAGGVPTDLTGATVEAEIRNKTAGTFIVALGTQVTLPNIVDVTMTGETMWATCPTKGVWDLQVTMSGGDVRTVLRGDVSVTGDVTDSVVAPVVRATPTLRKVS